MIFDPVPRRIAPAWGESDKSGVMGELCRIIRHLGSGIGRIAGARDHKQDSFVSGEEWTECFVAEMEKLSAPLLRLPS